MLRQSYPDCCRRGTANPIEIPFADDRNDSRSRVQDSIEPHEGYMRDEITFRPTHADAAISTADDRVVPRLERLGFDGAERYDEYRRVRR